MKTIGNVILMTWIRIWCVFSFLWFSDRFLLKWFVFCVAMVVDSSMAKLLIEPLHVSKLTGVLIHVVTFFVSILLAMAILTRGS